MENIEKINHHDAKFIDENGDLQTIQIPVVQDLARLKTLPGEFIQNPVAAHPFPSNTSFDAVDIAKLRSESGRVLELRKLARICGEWGMFTIRNHGVDVEEVKRVVEKFFELPFEEKKSSVGTYMDADNMGYGRNFFKAKDQPLDWIDRLTMKAAPVGSTDGLRVWPTNPANFRAAIENYVNAAREVLDELLEALAVAEAISLDNKHSFSRYFDRNTSEMNVRINYYPFCPRPDLTMGLVPHTDASALTLLTQFGSQDGLQVLKGGEWMTVPWPCDALLVNVGDFIEIMSNGRLQSSWHRAVAQPDTARFSVALFYRPRRGAEIGPANDGEPVKYKKVVVGEYLDHFYKVSPTATKQAIMFAKFI